MAYTDKKVGTDQRAVTIATVALLQGAIVVALIDSFGIAFIPTEPDPPLRADKQWPITPPPPPDPVEDKVEPKTQDPPITAIERPIDLPVPDDTHAVSPIPIPIPRPTPVLPIFDPPRPDPKPSFTPRQAAPRNARENWVTRNDYPARDLREGNQGTTRFRVTVGTDGRVQSCEIVASSGFERLDAATCKNVSRRARFDPATDAGGAPVSGTYSSAIRWVIPD